MRAGTLLGGRFVVEREAGAGGMGAVFRATDRVEGSPVALKVLRSREALDVERFARESAILAGLFHPGIVRYVTHGTTPTGDPYLAMEWLEGEDLGARLARAPLSTTESLVLVRRVTDALAFAHERGVVHRDIKPSNVFLVERDVEQVKILDFGIARPTRSTQRLTRTGVLLGTPGYIAPELVQGPPTHDPRADIFSLGCLLFECLTGVPAFEGSHPMAVLAKLLLHEAAPIRQHRPELPEALDRLVARMLNKDAELRPANAVEVQRELGHIIDERSSWTAATLRPPAISAPPITPRGEYEEDGPISLTMSEKRLVSVVLAGDPDADEALPSRRLPVDELQEAIAPTGGEIRALTGDALVVTLWGSGSAVDRAERAVHCALILRAHLPDTRIAVVSGRGLVASRVVEGEVIERGVETLRAARPGPIHVDGVTAGMMTTRFSLEHDGPLFLLRPESAVVESPPVLLGKPTQCLGRARELSTLEGIFAGCVEDHVASAALVLGPAGAGKSRVRREFLDSVRKSGASALVLYGRASSLGAGAPLGMIADAIRSAAGVKEADAPELRRHKLRMRLGRRLSGATLSRVAAFLGEIAGAPFPDHDLPALRAARANAVLMGDSMRAAWEDWLGAECSAEPVILVLEDLHWGDAATVGLVDAMLRNLRELRLMVLVLARPDVETQFPGLWSEREVQTIKLGPLSRRASERLVGDALGPNATPEAIARIVDRADGNPFYLEELVRAVASGRGDVFPDSVLGTVEARLDAEGVEAKRVLRAASIFGERFSARGVAVLLGGERNLPDATAWLSRLGAREIVSRAGGPLPVGDPEYAFSHAIVREAAYATLTENDRVLGHRLAGEWLERTNSAEPAAIAVHFQRGADLRRAVIWYLRAAEHALEANDFGAAVEAVKHAEACGASGNDLGELRLIQAEVDTWRGELSSAEQHGVEAAELFAAGSSGWFRSVKQAILVAGKLGSFERVERWVEPLRTTAPAPRARAAQLRCLGECALQLTFGGRRPAADGVLGIINQTVTDPSLLDPQVAAVLDLLHATRAAYAGDFSACLEGFEASLAAFERAGDRRNACAIRSNLGFALAELGDFIGAEEALRAAYAVADRMGLQDVSLVALHTLGHVLAYRNRLAEAKQMELRAVEGFAKLGDPRMEGVARTYLAKIAFLSGEPEAAEREARAAAVALEVAPPLRAGAIAVLSRALLALGRKEEALTAATEAHDLLESLGGIEEGESLVRLAYAEATAANGDEATFREAIRRARTRLLERVEKISDPAWRDRFLTGVPENSQTMALAAKGRASLRPA